jgi:hypothetical protein
MTEIDHQPRLPSLAEAKAQALKKAERERIDPQTCEYGRRYANVVSIYGIFEGHEEIDGYRSKEWFVRKVPDGDWVCAGLLPEHVSGFPQLARFLRALKIVLVGVGFSFDALEQRLVDMSEGAGILLLLPAMPGSGCA